MGIYVQSFAASPTGIAPRQLADALVRAAAAWAAERDISELFYAAPNDERAWLSFYPPCGGIAFRITDGRVSFDAKTSIAGPGYHAALIELCDHLARDLGLAWRWEAGGDQTGYAQHRDRAALERAFEDQFFAFCAFYRDSARPNAHHALNLSEGLAIDGADGVATPLGPMPLDFFLEAGTAERRESAPEIYPWWDEDSSGDAFWRNALRSILWTEAEWRAPQRPWEEHVHASAFAAARRCTHAPEIEAAVKELTELAQSSIEDGHVPAPGGIGWGRVSRAFFLPGPWRINLPGYYVETIENDGGTTCLWFGDEEVRGSSFTLTLKEPGVLAWDKALADAAEHAAATHRFRMAHPRASSVEGFWTAKAECQVIDASGQGQLLILSLFSRAQNLLPRLEALARDVWFDPPPPRAAKQGDA